MALLYFKYLTNIGNTIIASQVNSFSLGPNEAQLQTDYDIPTIQPVYLYRVTGSTIIPNIDANINAYLTSIGSLPDTISRTEFTTYTGTTAPNQFALKSRFNTFTGTTAPNTYETKTHFNSFTATTLPTIYESKSHFNAYSASTQTNLNGKLNVTDFNIYSGATLSLIQSSQAGLDPKQSVFVTTTGNLTGATYNAAGGTAGTGQFTSAPTTLNGVALSNGKRILVKNQTDPRQNGIYVVISAGTWNRATDMDNSASGEVSAGNYTFVETGSTLAGSGWVVTGNGILTLNTDPINWTKFNETQAYVGGTGINIVGQTVSLNGGSIAGNGLSWSGTQLNVVPTGGTLGTLFNSKVDKTQYNAFTATTISSANNGLTESPNQTVRLGGSLTGNTTITTATGSRLNFAGWPVQYNTDLSANYNIRSHTDVGYVTGLTSQLSTTASNGITKFGLTFRLGGSLTGATTINALSFGLTNSGTTGQYNILRTTGSVNTKSRNSVNIVGVTIGGVDTATLKISATGSTFTDARGGASANGLQYAADYSAGITKRTLIDQGYFSGNTLHTSKQLLVYVTGSTNISVTSPVALILNRLIRNDNSFYAYTGGTKIRIIQAGTYDVSYQINVANDNGILKSVGANIAKNGVVVNETATSGTLGGQTSASANLSLPPTQLTFAANDIIQLIGYRLIVPLSGNANTVSNGVFLSIVKKY